MVVLVGYASMHGSTREIAERIAARLGEHRIEVEVHSLDQVRHMARYDVFVLGSPVYGGAWLTEASQFVRRHLGVLSAQPVWLFSVGVMEAQMGARRGRRAAYRKQPKEISGFREAIHPRDHHIFSGVIERDRLTNIGRLIFKVVGGRYGDLRDWKEIDAWAEEIAGEVASGPSEQTRSENRNHHS